MNTSRTVTVNDSGLAAPTLDNATAGAQQNTVYWQTVSAATGYTLYWTDDGSAPTTSSDNITISNNTSTSYVHGGLDSTKTYNYKMVANIGSSASTLSNQVSNSPSAFASCNTSGTIPQIPIQICWFTILFNNLEGLDMMFKTDLEPQEAHTL